MDQNGDYTGGLALPYQKPMTLVLKYRPKAVLANVTLTPTKPESESNSERKKSEQTRRRRRTLRSPLVRRNRSFVLSCGVRPPLPERASKCWARHAARMCGYSPKIGSPCWLRVLRLLVSKFAFLGGGGSVELSLVFRFSYAFYFTAKFGLNLRCLLKDFNEHGVKSVDLRYLFFFFMYQSWWDVKYFIHFWWW